MKSLQNSLITHVMIISQKHRIKGCTLFGKKSIADWIVGKLLAK